jgi:predicted CoA-substrate-specific enzyme activase
MTKFYCGCDVGSTYTKCVILGEDKEIISSSIIRSKVDPVESSKVAIAEATKNISEVNGAEDFTYIVGTGYGRAEVASANCNVSEISCHAMGAHTVNSNIRTIIDIGGQDVKGISVDEVGSVKDFGMNDKCAAGTGRFFELMARCFEMDLQQFSDLSLRAKKVIHITSQCSVFAETEVISLLAQKKQAADIAAGIQLSVAKRCFVMAKSVGLKDSVTITGGCAKNEGLILALEKVLKVKIARLDIDPQLMGALGAAVFAHQKSHAKVM